MLKPFRRAGEIALENGVREMVTVTKADRQQYSHAVGTQMDPLVLRDCRQEAIDAVKADGPSAFEASFQLFGGVAARELMSDPAVNAEMQAIGDNVDKSGWAALMTADSAKPLAK